MLQLTTELSDYWNAVKIFPFKYLCLDWILNTETVIFLSCILYVTIYCIKRVYIKLLWYQPLKSAVRFICLNYSVTKLLILFLTLVRNHGKCFLTMNYTILISLALVLKTSQPTKEEFSCDEKLISRKVVSIQCQTKTLICNGTKFWKGFPLWCFIPGFLINIK